MNEIKQLTALELRSYYGINTFLHTRDKKERRRYALLAFAFAIVFAMIVFYVGGLVYGLCRMGLSDIVPSYLAVISSAVIFFFGIFKAGHVIFGTRGLDILLSLPIRRSSVVLSRFIGMYAEDLFLTLLVILPGVAVGGICMPQSAYFYISMIIGAFLIPLIPLTVATAVGTLIAALSGRMKHKNLVQTFLCIAFVIAVLVGSVSFGGAAESITAEMLAELAGHLNGLTERIYPPAVWLSRAAEGGILWLCLFAAVSFSAFALLIALVSRFHETVTRRLGADSARHDYKMETLRDSNVLTALLRREAKRYFASSVYVTNTVIGPILGALMSAAVLFAGKEKLTALLPIEGGVASLIPFAVAAVFTTMTASCVSISMEGKHFWLVRTLPITPKQLFDSKILFNLILILPFYVLSEILLAIALLPSLIELLWLILIPAAVIIFSVVFGISINLKLCRLDWTKEEAVVKQSAPAAIGGFAGMIVSVLFGFLVFVTPEPFKVAVKALGVAVIGVLTLVLYRSNNKARLERL